MTAKLREKVRRQASGRCEYCRLPERVSPLRFQVDHIIAKKHRGGEALRNLAWSCADCNAHKGSDLSGIDPDTSRLEHLYNPRIDLWEEHFICERGEMRGKTAIGRVTVTLLEMNRPERVALRFELIASGLLSDETGTDFERLQRTKETDPANSRAAKGRRPSRNWNRRKRETLEPRTFAA